MKIGYPGFYSLFLFLFVLLPTEKAVRTGDTPLKDGALIVKVTWGDINNTPATGVYVEAHGFVQRLDSTKSVILKMSSEGRYEASLLPGYYDVFVSDGGSFPRCRRLYIRPGLTTFWTLKLEIDDVYMNQQVLAPGK